MGLNRSILAAGAMFVIATGVGLSAAHAQQPSPPASTQPRAAVNDRDIEAFVAAATEVRQLNQAWVPKVQEAAKKGPKEEEATRQQAISEMTRAVQKNGLSVDRYQEIYATAQADPEVGRKVREKMQPGK